ncbi:MULTISPECIES: molybdate ABC transporter substrate-binding protein [Actinomadura]|uniref:Molybdate ABC transporter substrate-binding protein n=1 Tax=Actinomadura litoris TaxID=2678616 RepID=A0A7K1L6L3_9ACTN|nr:MULTISPECIES: molybdate ABC transporter substrate-binding protein [Actinomadura]MBT2209369.1 molybdate ABC transporter substrate-binding protein [Actinomadura sp. NEAU-AAG7]MUN40061.1 molybdate ABC transporter substrate-binding protein [Actinomadura litoris]
MPDSPGRRRPRASALLTVLVLLGLTAGCGGSSGPVTLRVLAASSLTEAFGEMGLAYSQANPGVKVRLEFGGSQEMAGRLSDHDPGDVLVTADEASMRKADRYLTGPRPVIAHNSMTIAVAPGNPRGIRDVRDLARPGLRVVAGAEIVPVGRYARQVLARAGVSVRWRSEEISARAVLDRIRTGDADAGLVYITDLGSAGAAASSVPIPANLNVTAAYPASAVRGGHHLDEANAFVSWLSTPEAQKLLGKYGFAGPGPAR